MFQHKLAKRSQKTASSDGPLQKRAKTNSFACHLINHIYEEIPPLIDGVCRWNRSGDDGQGSRLEETDELLPNVMTNPECEWCPLCKKTVSSLRSHANANHLPWFVDPSSACALCHLQTGHHEMMWHHSRIHDGVNIQLTTFLWHKKMMALFSSIGLAVGLSDISTLPQYAKENEMGISCSPQFRSDEERYFKEFGTEEPINPHQPLTLADCSHWLIVLRLIAKAGQHHFSQLVRSWNPEEDKRMTIPPQAGNRPKEPNYMPPIFFTGQFKTGRNNSVFGSIRKQTSAILNSMPKEINCTHKRNTSLQWCPISDQYVNENVTGLTADKFLPNTKKLVTIRSLSERNPKPSTSLHNLCVPTDLSKLVDKCPMLFEKPIKQYQFVKAARKCCNNSRQARYDLNIYESTDLDEDLSFTTSPPLPPRLIDENICGKRVLETCIMCRQDVLNLRKHASAKHLPWFVDVMITCQECHAMTADSESFIEHHRDGIRLKAKHWICLMTRLFEVLIDGLGLSKLEDIPYYVRDHELGLTIRDDCLLEDGYGCCRRGSNPCLPETLYDCFHWLITLRLVALAGPVSVSHLLDPSKYDSMASFTNSEDDADLPGQLIVCLDPADNSSIGGVGLTSAASEVANRGRILSNHDDDVRLERNLDYSDDDDDEQQYDSDVSVRYPCLTGEGVLVSGASQRSCASSSNISYDCCEQGDVSDGYINKNHDDSTSSFLSKPTYCPSPSHHQVDLEDSPCLRSLVLQRNHFRTYSDDRTQDPNSQAYSSSGSEDGWSKIYHDSNTTDSSGVSQQKNHHHITNEPSSQKIQPCLRSRSTSSRSGKASAAGVKGRRSLDVLYKRDSEYEQAIANGRISPKTQLHSQRFDKRGRPSAHLDRYVNNHIVDDLLFDDNDSRSEQSSMTSFNSTQELQHDVYELKKDMASLTEVIHNMIAGVTPPRKTLFT